jgi:hypothetical protein
MERFDWEKAEGLGEAPLDKLLQPGEGGVTIDQLSQVREDTGLQCSFCGNGLPVYDEHGVFVALYHCRTLEGLTFPVCADCCEIAVKGAPWDKVTRWAGVTTVSA